jgi:DNA-binding MarR family transcriptional regulator
MSGLVVQSYDSPIDGVITQVKVGAISADDIEDEEDASVDDATVGAHLEREMSYGFLPTLVGHQVRKAYSKLFESFTDALKTIGLAPGQYSALKLIALNPGLSQMALADATGMDRTGMVPITNRFAQAGWVRRLRRSDDRRVYSLELTPRGEAALKKALPLIEGVEKRFAAPLSREEQRTTRTLLARIADSEVSSNRLSKRNASADINYGDLPDQLGYQLRRAYSYLFRTFMSSFKSLQLAPGTYSALVLISFNPGRSQIDLAAAAGLDGSTIVPITDRFVKLRWVRRVRRKSDRRVYALRITPAGQAVLDEARPMIAAREKRLATVLNARERDALIDMLTRICDSEEPVNGPRRGR